MSFLNEAFKALNALNEDTFSLNDDGIKKLSDFEQNDDLIDEISVIDPEAETEDDLQDSYIGKVILDCSVCHSKLYKDKTEVTVDEEQQLANVGEECPYCYTSDGFKVIGEVTAFNSEESEETPEEIPEEDSEELEEGFVGNALGSLAGSLAGGAINRALNDDIEDPEELEEGLFNRKKKSQPNYASQQKVNYNGDFYSKFSDGKIVYNGQQYDSEDDARNAIDRKKESERTKKVGTRGKYNSSEKKELRYNPHRDTYESLEELEEGIFSKKKSKTTAPKSSVKKQEWELFDIIRGQTTGRRFYNKFDAEKEAAKLEKDTGHVYKVQLVESVNNVNVETDDSIVNVETDENGKVVVSTEPKTELGNGDEVLAPLSDETEQEILNNDSEAVTAEDEVDVNIDEFDEESFDELGESYLKNIYENVQSYKTTKVVSKNNTLKVEGLIKFNSGNTKKTSFVFESKDATPSGTLRFIGENLNITRGKKAFTVRGKVNEGKFISESLNYNYKAKDTNGKSTRIYGTVKKRG